MKKILIPALISFVGLAGGTAAGVFLHPSEHPEDQVAAAHSEGENLTDATKDTSGHGAQTAVEYVKLPNQFVVPLVNNGRVSSLVVLSLSLEIPAGQTEQIYSREPRLRDEVLQLLFDHANTGGFDGAFTEADRMAALRRGLLEVARMVCGEMVSGVLITDIVRQDS